MIPNKKRSIRLSDKAVYKVEPLVKPEESKAWFAISRQDRISKTYWIMNGNGTLWTEDIALATEFTDETVAESLAVLLLIGKERDVWEYYWATKY
jgi:hypothetical protein